MFNIFKRNKNKPKRLFNYISVPVYGADGDYCGNMIQVEIYSGHFIPIDKEGKISTANVFMNDEECNVALEMYAKRLKIKQKNHEAVWNAPIKHYMEKTND